MKLETLSNKLNNLTDAKEIDQFIDLINSSTVLKELIYHDKLLNLTPVLGMFIPCDEEGNVLDEPKNYKMFAYTTSVLALEWREDFEQFEEAEKRVLFKGFKYDYVYLYYKSNDDIIRVIKYGKDKVFNLFDDYSPKKARTLNDLTHLNLDINESAIKYYVK